jgi:predicted MFS family arabinose efflux permease
LPNAQPGPNRHVVITALGIAQIFAWGTSFYFPAVFATPIVRETGWPLEWVVGGTSLGLLIAGLVSPKVGSIVQRRGGRPVLLASSLFYAAGLVMLGLAPWLPVYLAGWLLIGAGMGTGLYDAVFATLGRMYGAEARGAIATLTLFGGFASTICWPLSALMIDHLGWRSACFAYAAIHLSLLLPLQIFATRGSVAPEAAKPAEQDEANAAPAASEMKPLVLLGLVLSLAAGIGSIVVVHLLIFLQARGLDSTSAVALGTLFGPAQVGARLIEKLFGGRYHPYWTMLGACSLMLIGLVLLALNAPLLVLTIVLYGAGYGVSWIARGTLPLALFGAARFPRLMGRLAFPSLMVQALAPSVGALLIERAGSGSTLVVLCALAALNCVLIALLWPAVRGQRVDD